MCGKDLKAVGHEIWSDGAAKCEQRGGFKCECRRYRQGGHMSRTVAWPIEGTAVEVRYLAADEIADPDKVRNVYTAKGDGQ
jgi:hypothetical protein